MKNTTCAGAVAGILALLSGSLARAQCGIAPRVEILGAQTAPLLRVDAPRLGAPFRVEVSGGRPLASATLGVAAADSPPVYVPLFQATLYVTRPLFSLRFQLDEYGRARPLDVPSIPLDYCTAGLVLQVGYDDPQAAGGIRLTHGLRVRFGDGPAVWVNTGEDKVTRDELRATADPCATTSSSWDGGTVRLFAAKNEVVSCNVVIEAPERDVRDVAVELDRLADPSGRALRTRPASGNQVFDFRDREIELFYVRYLQIKGLSLLSYDDYDERHVPQRMRRPWSGAGIGTGLWSDRPDHDKEYPDIAVPLEAVGRFTVTQGRNQSVWIDIYVPADAPPGRYTGTVRVRTGTIEAAAIPIELLVRDFALPDQPTAKTMLVLGYSDVNLRHTGVRWPNPNSAEAQRSATVRDNYFKVARRHRLTAVDANDGPTAIGNRPHDHWLGKLDGSFYTAAHGYAGPGTGTPHDLFVIGLYGSWGWQTGNQADMHRNLDAWQSWFDGRSLPTPLMLYVQDEPDLGNAGTVAQLNAWLSWMASNQGPGRRVRSFVTAPMPGAMTLLPDLDIAASWIGVGIPAQWDAALQHYQQGRRQAWCYNGRRPANGSFATEDDGVALRALSWAQWKRGIDRWFYWESTYWNNFQGGTGETNVFAQAMTFGGSNRRIDPVRGETSWNYSNGDGVLFYPGTDTVYPQVSYGLDGPIASLRMKHWRRGVQDHAYLTMAHAIDPVAVQGIVGRMVPQVLWECGVSDPRDPTWVRTDISWSIDPDAWEQARRELADILD